MNTVISVNRANINKRDAQGNPLPCIRVEDALGIRFVHAVELQGPAYIGPYEGGRICVTTEAPVKEIHGPAPCEQPS